MSPERLRQLLSAVAHGQLGVDDAIQSLADLPFGDLGHTLLDHHRELRQGVPETIYGAGKSSQQIQEILVAAYARHGRAIATRVSVAVAAEILQHVPAAVYDPQSRLLRLGDLPSAPEGGPLALVVCAGTSDLPVAEECAQTLHFFGHKVQRLTDVGVAGLHRLLVHLDTIRAADVIVAIAGMEGALASVVGGLADCPVIGVPTSVGYGVGAGGHAALHAMLSSCAAGVGVMNIDNGHGAAILAHQILRRVQPKAERRSILQPTTPAATPKEL